MRIIAVVALLLVGACGGSPTGPAPVPLPPVVSVSTPEPPPVVVVPVEPAPVPVPPTPAPTRLLYAAATDSAHWFGPELVPNRFQVEVFSDRVQFGPVTLEIAQRDRDAMILMGDQVTVTLRRYSEDRWTWLVNGIAGQSVGTMQP